MGEVTRRAACQQEPAHCGMVLVSRRAGAPVAGSTVCTHSVRLASGPSPEPLGLPAAFLTASHIAGGPAWRGQTCFAPPAKACARAARAARAAADNPRCASALSASRHVMRAGRARGQGEGA